VIKSAGMVPDWNRGEASSFALMVRTYTEYSNGDVPNSDVCTGVPSFVTDGV
jgi:hypothetical protein